MDRKKISSRTTSHMGNTCKVPTSRLSIVPIDSRYDVLAWKNMFEGTFWAKQSVEVRLGNARVVFVVPHTNLSLSRSSSQQIILDFGARIACSKEKLTF